MWGSDYTSAAATIGQLGVYRESVIALHRGFQHLPMLLIREIFTESDKTFIEAYRW